MFQEKQPFERIEVTRDQALELFSDNNFKVVLILLVLYTSKPNISYLIPLYLFIYLFF